MSAIGRIRSASLVWALSFVSIVVGVAMPSQTEARRDTDGFDKPAPVVTDGHFRVEDVAMIDEATAPVSLGGSIAARTVNVGQVVTVRPAPASVATKSAPAGVPANAQVHVLGEKAAAALGGAKVAFTVVAETPSATDVSTQIAIDYSSFANTFGGDWAHRLRIVRVPACAQTTPEVPACKTQEVVPSTNDWRAQVLTVNVPAAANPAVVAARDTSTAVGSPSTAAPLGGTATTSAPANGSPSSINGTTTLPGTTTTAPASTTRTFTRVAGAITPVAEPVPAPAVYVLSSGSGGLAGNYAASSLSTSSAWRVGLGSGSFEWSYPVPMVPAPHGATPSLTLSYSSQKLDGMTVDANNQSAVAGLGFDLSNGFIERRYKSCSRSNGLGAQPCFDIDNAVISFAGHSSELVMISASTDQSEWRLEEDPNWRVTRFSGALGSANGDNDGEWWRVITPDGTVTNFGRGFADGDSSPLSSTLTMPVWAAASSKPCFASPGHVCTQAWRWMADSSTDTNGNSQTYFYSKETNKYGPLGPQATSYSYDMAARLVRIEYGETSSNLFTFTDVGATLNYQIRCIDLADTCETPTSANGSRFPDVPNDLICVAATCAQPAPTFFSAYRLVSIDTWSRENDTYAYADRIQLSHDWGCRQGTTADPGVCADDNAGLPTHLYLRYIQRFGSPAAGTSPTAPATGGFSLPAIRFDSMLSDSTDWRGQPLGSPYPNRADATPTNGVYPQYVPRITHIRDELGGQTIVTYGQPSGCIGKSAAFPATGYVHNGTNCYPQWGSAGAPGSSQTATGWILYNKYVVTKVTVRDLSPDSTDQVTRYDYKDDPTVAAYRYSDTRWTKDPEYNEWRGYSKIIVRTGTDPNVTQTRYLVYRGMNGDPLQPSGIRNVLIEGTTQAPQLLDEKWFAGIVRETRVMQSLGAQPLDFDSGVAETSTVNTPVAFAVTGTSRKVGVQSVDKYTNAAAAATPIRASSMRTTVTTTWAANGLPETITTAGDGVATKCRRLDYAVNSATSMVDRVRGDRLYDGACDPDPNSTADPNVPHAGYVIARSTLTYFDGHNGWNDAPTAGNATKLAVWTGTTSLNTLSTYDARGRLTSSTDPKGFVTNTAYDTAVGPYHTVTTTNPATWTTTTTFDPRRGQANQAVDANGKVTHQSYDAVGRLAAVWRDGFTSQATPTVAFSYKVEVNQDPAHPEIAQPVPGHIVRTTSTLSTSPFATVASYALIDSLGRTRETQTPSPTAQKMIVTGDTTWEARGLPTATWGSYAYTLPLVWSPDRLLIQPAASRPAGPVTTIAYDTQGRPVSSTIAAPGETTLVTTTTYDGRKSTVEPPGATAGTRTELDAYGRTARRVELSAAAGVDAATTYTYTARDETASIRDNSNNTTLMTYDLAGRRTGLVDPNAGPTTVTYDNNGNMATGTDARGTTLTYSYDNLNRKTAELKGTTTLASWTYDPAGARGQPATKTRIDAVNGTFTETLGYDAQYRVTQRTIAMPQQQGSLAGSYQYTYTYDVQGHQLTVTHPAAGGLPAETVTTGYDALANPNTLTSPLASYVSASSRDDINRPTNRSLGGVGAGTVSRGYGYDAMQRLNRLTTSLPGNPASLTQDLTYRFDAAGNIASVADATSAGAGQRECFGYDARARLTAAYTTTAVNADQTCGLANANGPTPYNETNAYDALGRMSARNGQTYAYGDAAHPYAPTTAAGGTTLTYNQLGGINVSTVAGISSQYVWDDEQRLQSVTASTCTAGTSCSVTNTYDADGQRLLRRNPDGTVTAYLSDGDELTTAPVAGQLLLTSTTGLTSPAVTVPANQLLVVSIARTGEVDDTTCQVGAMALTDSTGTAWTQVSSAKSDNYGSCIGSSTYVRPSSFVSATSITLTVSKAPAGVLHLLAYTNASFETIGISGQLYGSATAVTVPQSAPPQAAVHGALAIPAGRTAAPSSGTQLELGEANNGRVDGQVEITKANLGWTIAPASKYAYSGVRLKSASAVARRSYATTDGTTVGTRSPSGYAVTASDRNGTPTVTIGSTGSASVRRYTPYGTERGGPIAFPNDHTYLNKPQDTTGLVSLGARFYNPVTGQFVSVDPLAVTTRTPYLYGNGDPVTNTDPTGRCSGSYGCADLPDGAWAVPGDVEAPNYPSFGNCTFGRECYSDAAEIDGREPRVINLAKTTNSGRSSLILTA